jgi:hypothetical protein
MAEKLEVGMRVRDNMTGNLGTIGALAVGGVVGAGLYRLDYDDGDPPSYIEPHHVTIVDQPQPKQKVIRAADADVEKRMAELKLELDRAVVEAHEWEGRCGDYIHAYGNLKNQNTELLAENARLRRSLEKLERAKPKR